MIVVYRITGAQADKMAGLLQSEIYEALKEGQPVTALAAMDGDEVAGALGGCLNDGVFELSSLYVYPEHRRKGAGRALMEMLGEILLGEGTEIRVEFTLENEENESLKPFLEALGYTLGMQEFPRYYLAPLEQVDLEKIPSGKSDFEVLSFADAPEQLLKMTSNISIKEGYPVPEGGLLSEKVDPHASFCVQSGDTIPAYIAVERIGRGMIRIPSLWWSSQISARDMFGMLVSMVKEIKKRYAPKTKLAVLAVNPTSEKLIKYMIKDAEPCSYSYYKAV